MGTAEYETPRERRQRRLSLLIVNITCFVFMMGFSIVLTGMYPYLLQMDPSADKKFLGWVVASYSCAQLVAFPLLGWLGNRIGSIRILCMITLAFYAAGFAFYSCLGAFPDPRKYYMIIARLLVGTSSGTLALSGTYVSSATTISERTTGMAMFSFSQTAGFILGPILQTAFTPLGENGIPYASGTLQLNMYTAASWMAAIMGFLTMFLYVPCLFHEHHIAKKEEEFVKLNALHKSTESSSKTFKRDLVAVFVCLYIYFIVSSNFVFIETLATPLAMDLLGMSNEEAVTKVGILLIVAASLCAVSFAMAGFLAKKFGDVNVIICCGLIPVVAANLFYFPYGGPLPVLQNSTLPAGNDSLLLGENSTVLEAYSHNAGGCPPSQEWCLYTPAPKAWQLIVGFLLTCTGYPITLTVSTSLYTKLLSSKQQGKWIGLLLSFGSLSRIIGPIFVTTVYTVYGPVVTFAATGAAMLSTLVVCVITRKRLVAPMQRRRSTS